MLPELFRIGPITVRGYGLMLAISFLVGVFYVERRARREGKPSQYYIILSYIMIIGGVVGARLAYVLFHLDEFAGRWSATFNPFAGDQYGIAGLNMQGGVILAVVASLAYMTWKRLPILETFDIFAPTVGIGLAITRVGCFLNGCCFGVPTHLPWGVVFPEGSMPYDVFHNTPLHPTQIYSSLYGFGLFLLLNWWYKRRRFDGQITAILFMLEAVLRYAIEYVRFYESEMHVSLLGMSPTWNQLMAIGLFLTGLAIYLYGRRRPLHQPSESAQLSRP